MPAAMPMMIGFLTSAAAAERSAAGASVCADSPSTTSARSLRMAPTVIITGRLIVMTTVSATAPSSP